MNEPPDRDPLVSCLCVTRHKPAKLRRAINCFLAQRYARKELVLVYETDDLETALVAREYHAHPEVSVHALGVTPKRTLGELRNLSIELAQGEYFCQWDDDDWYHVDRVGTQLRVLLENRQVASVLTNWFIFDATARRAYLSHMRLWEGSILCRKDVIGSAVHYPALRRLEDSFFLNALIAAHGVYPTVAPNLYVYEVHQANTWSQGHFQMLLSSAQPLSDPTSLLIGDILDGKYSAPEASVRLSSPDLLAELKYFHSSNLNLSNTQLERYRRTAERLEAAKAAQDCAARALSSIPL